MRKPLTFSLTLLAAIALLLTGCNPILPSGGKSVKFTANSKSQPATKTTYAGNAASTGSTHEDIYWSPNDAIRIYSGDPSVVRPVIQTENGVCADYKLVVPNATSTRASLENEASNGLEWLDDPTGTAVTFYAVYPRSTRGSEYGWFTMSIPSEQTFATPTGTDMTHAYMLAQNTLKKEQFNSEVSLDFYPAFTAFQINLKSKDDELTLKKFRIYSEDNHLAGDYYGKLIAVNDREKDNEYFAFNFDKTLRMDFACVLDDNNQPTSLQNEVSVEFPYYETETETQKNTKISPTSAVDFTLLALPYGIVNATETYDTKPYLTNLWLEVTFEKENGEEFTKKLALKQTTTNEDVTTTAFLKFASCKKYRINGLAVDGGSKWKLNILSDVLDWTFYDEKLSSLNQINVNPVDDDNHTVKVTGSIETTAKWLADHPDTGSNHELPNDVPEDDPSYYARYYQVRTLNWSQSQAPNKQFFEMSFTPTAPIGGYWQMIPEYPDQSSVGHFRFEVKIEDLTDWEEQDVPHAQIIDKRVFIRIYPVYENDDDHIYEMTLKCYFSPNKSFDPTYSADSELQDVHKKGDFSYWRFRLERYAGGPYTVSAADEHESLKPRN